MEWARISWYAAAPKGPPVKTFEWVCSNFHDLFDLKLKSKPDWRLETGELELEVALEKIRFAEIKLESLIFIGLTLYLRLKELGGGGPS